MSGRRRTPVMLRLMSRGTASVFSVALLALLVLTALTGEAAVVALAVLVVQGMIAAAPSPPDARGRAHGGPRFVPALLAGVVATLLAAFPSLLVGSEGMRAGREGIVSNGVIAGLVPAVAVAVIAALVAQMLRRDGRPKLVSSTGHAVTLGVFAALAASWVAASRAVAGADVVIIGAAAVAAALLVWGLPVSRSVASVGALVAASVAGGVAAFALGGSATPVFGLLLGAAVSIFAVLGQVLGRAWSAGRIHSSQGWGFPGALAVALPAPVVHVFGQLLGLPGL